MLFADTFSKGNDSGSHNSLSMETFMLKEETMMSESQFPHIVGTVRENAQICQSLPRPQTRILSLLEPICCSEIVNSGTCEELHKSVPGAIHHKYHHLSAPYE